MKKSFTIIFCFFTLFSYSQSFNEEWATEQVLETPESVFYNQERNEIYVSNINGKPLDKDGNGFIALMDTTGLIKELKWITGFDAPKGMAVFHDTLLVTDIDKIHIISISRQKVVQTIKVEGAGFLNDVIFLEDGSALITDMSENKIMKLDENGVSVWLTDPLLMKPNGIALYKSQLAVGVKNSILKLDMSDKSISVLIDETGPVDGLIYVGGNKFVISDWSGRIMLVNPSEKVVLSNSTEKNIQAADLGYIPYKKWVLVPTFFDNRVFAAQLP